MIIENHQYKSLTGIISGIYEPAGFHCTQPVAEAESGEYDAHMFLLNGQAVRYRAAKVTPTKTGQFVTLWKRENGATIQPFAVTDDICFVIINTNYQQHSGQFIFPAAILLEQGIFSGNNKEGKRAFRVYPPWDAANSKQAQKTQSWQVQWFLETPAEQPVDTKRLKHLLLHQ